jgi:hypothetical protein
VWELALAVKQQNTRKIHRFAKDNPRWLNFQEPRYGSTLLIWAVGVEKYESSKALLECGADPNIQTTFAGETALFVAAGFSWIDDNAKKDAKFTQLLLQHGANPNINYQGIAMTNGESDITEPGTSSLMHSLGCGIEKTKALVEGGADLNYKMKSGITAAIIALMKCSFNVTDDEREYAYYLIVEKHAKVTDPYYRGTHNALPGNKQHDSCRPVDILRNWMPDLNTNEFRIKMDIVKEFYRQGVDYRKVRITPMQLQRIKQNHPNDWEEYAKKY